MISHEEHRSSRYMSLARQPSHSTEKIEQHLDLTDLLQRSEQYSLHFQDLGSDRAKGRKPARGQREGIPSPICRIRSSNEETVSNEPAHYVCRCDVIDYCFICENALIHPWLARNRQQNRILRRRDGADPLGPYP